MLTRTATALVLTLLVFGRTYAAEKPTPAKKADTFSLTPAESAPGTPRFSEAQLAYVQSWIKQKAPECPPAASAAVADDILDELQQHYPGKFEQLLSADFSSGDFESMLLRHVGVRLSGATQGMLREEVARRRIVALQTAGGRKPGTPTDAAGMLAKIKDASQAQYRRLLEGKIDDDDLEILLKKINQTGTVAKEVVPAKPKVLTALDIVAEFSRHNQAGSAMQRVQAYTVEGKLKTATGEEQDLLLFRMRPDRFRLVVRAGGVTRLILAGDGTHFWQQAPGQATRLLSAQELGQQIYMAEFTDPLLAGEGYGYERLADGVIDGIKVYRIAVRRKDNSSYVACIGQENFREIGRENDDRSMARYANFRDVAGVTFAFREEATDAAGRKGVFEIARITPNSGLIQDFFDLPAQQNKGYFEIERLLAPVAQNGGSSHR